MSMRGRAEPNNHNPTLHIYLIVACPGHIMESTKGIEMKLGL